MINILDYKKINILEMPPEINMNVLTKLNKAINDFPILKKTTSLLIQVPPENSLEAQLIISKNLTERGFKVIILSGGRSCQDLISIYQEKKIELKNIHVLDLICKSQNLQVKNTDTVTHMTGIKNLTEIALYLNKMIVPNKTVMFIDSMTSMLLYTDETLFTRFISDVIRKMKTRDIHIILLLIKTKHYDNLRAELKYVCDQQLIF